ncbi:hypothetical protein KIN20_024236 [Parelaphostrongylus tenuis]|uniref:Uncharacterized protein n=1 Tax=Parelaphostrongylus tenuis TaxID=148309 RepID=A0AAD5MT44_PARTN|nr:hypothetical protein KIN20_024236 [Parelaphostrongylus tenuis]
MKNTETNFIRMEYVRMYTRLHVRYNRTVFSRCVWISELNLFGILSQSSNEVITLVHEISQKLMPSESMSSQGQQGSLPPRPGRFVSLAEPIISWH